jgi:hypothetical protein
MGWRNSTVTNREPSSCNRTPSLKGTQIWRAHDRVGGVETSTSLAVDGRGGPFHGAGASEKRPECPAKAGPPPRFKM